MWKYSIDDYAHKWLNITIYGKIVKWNCRQIPEKSANFINLYFLWQMDLNWKPWLEILFTNMFLPVCGVICFQHFHPNEFQWWKVYIKRNGKNEKSIKNQQIMFADLLLFLIHWQKPFKVGRRIFYTHTR